MEREILERITGIENLLKSKLASEEALTLARSEIARLELELTYEKESHANLSRSLFSQLDETRRVRNERDIFRSAFVTLMDRGNLTIGEDFVQAALDVTVGK